MTRMVNVPTLQGGIRGGQPRDVEQFARQVTTFFDRFPAEASVSVSAEATNVVTVSIQARDRKGRDIEKAVLIEVWVATSSGGSPAGVQSVAFTTGTVIQTISSNQHYRVRTNSTGLAVLTITISGAATRYVSAVILGEVEDSTAATWT